MNGGAPGVPPVSTGGDARRSTDKLRSTVVELGLSKHPTGASMRTLMQTLVVIISTSLLGAAQADPTAIIHTSAGDLQIGIRIVKPPYRSIHANSNADACRDNLHLPARRRTGRPHCHHPHLGRRPPLHAVSESCPDRSREFHRPG